MTLRNRAELRTALFAFFASFAAWLRILPSGCHVATTLEIYLRCRTPGSLT